MAKYAYNTKVPVEQTRAEIERTLEKYGATHFGYATAPDKAMIEFVASKRRVRFVLPLPNAQDRGFEQKRRQRWRALLLSIKAKLEAVDAGIAAFEAEFLANIVVPNGETVEQWLRPQIAQAYETQKMPEMLMLEGPR